MTPFSRDPEALLRYDGFVRALARRLVTDAHTAEDIAQVTMVAALRAERIESARAWLTAVVERVASNFRRADSRRHAHERAAARAEAVPSTAELVEREAARRAVVDAVLALDEPYRDVIVLRYLEGLPPREISQRLGLPVETVRTRIQRALARLHMDLVACKDAHGKDSFSNLLAAFGSAAPWVVMMTMKAKLLSAAALLVVMALAWIAYGVMPAPERPLPENAATGPSLTASPTSRAASDSAPDRVAVTTSKPDASRATEACGALVVRAVWEEDKQPAGDIHVMVQERVRTDPYANPLEARTGADGTVRFARVRAGEVSVALDRGDYARATVTSGEEASLTIEIKTGVTVHGVVVDAAGVPVAGADIWISRSISGEGFVVAHADAQGRFSVRAFRWAILIGARAAGHAPSSTQQVGAGAGAKVEVRIVLPGPGAVLAGLVLDPDGKPVAGADVFAGHLDMTANRTPKGGFPSGLARTRSDAQGRFEIDGLDPGKNEVYVRTDGLALWRSTVELFATTRTPIEARLSRGGAIVGSVRTSTGEPVLGAAIRVGGWASRFGSFGLSAKDGMFRIDQVTTGEVEVLLGSDRHGRAQTRLVIVEGQETRWDHVFAPPLAIQGRVVDESGKPLAGWYVRVEDEEYRKEDFDHGMEPTAADGSFTVANMHDRPHRVQAEQRGSKFASALLTGVRPSDSPIELRVRHSRMPTAHIRGTLQDAHGKPCIGALISPFEPTMRGGAVEMLKDADGRFDFGPFPPGEWALSVRVPNQPELLLGPQRIEPNGTWDLGIVRLTAPGTLRVTLEREEGVDETARLDLAVFVRSRFTRVEFTRVGDVLTSAPMFEGEHMLRMTGVAIAADMVPFAIAAARETRIVVRVRAGVPITVRAVEPEPDRSVTGAVLTVRAAHGRVVYEGSISRRTDAPFELKLVLAKGSYAFEMTTTGGKRAQASVEITDPAKSPAPLELKLR